MRHIIYCLGVFLCMVGSGCETVHVGNQSQIPIAIWMPMTAVSQEGNKQEPQTRDVVSKALSNHGIQATMDDQGISVPADEAQRACETLLTDKDLINSHVSVLLLVAAGTGQKTNTGFEIPKTAMVTPPYTGQ